MNQRKPKVMLVAGEASGDRYAAEIFQELANLIPGIQGIGMGGSHMVEAGIDVRYDSTHIAVIGVMEAIKHFREIKRALNLMEQIACEEKPDLLICVDYKEFNFRLAGKAKNCGVKVLFYVSPQVWAWRPGRVKKYGDVVDMMAVIFPFEISFYKNHNIPVQYVGHPLVDKVHPALSKTKSFELFHLDSSATVVGLFPGSRGNEIRRLLPVMLQAAVILKQQYSRIQFVLSQSQSLSDEDLAGYIESFQLPLSVVRGQTYEVMQCCDAIMIASGTATLEAALIGVPMAITYKVTFLTYVIAKWLVNLPFIGLPNILAGKMIVKEFIQADAKAETLAAEVDRLLSDRSYAQQMRDQLLAVKEKLGTGGGIGNVAQLAASMVSG